MSETLEAEVPVFNSPKTRAERRRIEREGRARLDAMRAERLAQQQAEIALTYGPTAEDQAAEAAAAEERRRARAERRRSRYAAPNRASKVEMAATARRYVVCRCGCQTYVILAAVDNPLAMDIYCSACRTRVLVNEP